MLQIGFRFDSGRSARYLITEIQSSFCELGYLSMSETSEKFVLVADDHPLCKEIVQICLDRMDGNFRLFGVSSFADLSGALDRLSRCDLLILDLSLGDSIGIDTLKRVRNGWPSVPILVLSGTENLQVQIGRAHV